MNQKNSFGLNYLFLWTLDDPLELFKSMDVRGRKELKLVIQTLLSIATTNKNNEGRPDVRIVLLKGIKFKKDSFFIQI